MQAYGADFARIYNLRWGNFATRAAPLLHAYAEAVLDLPGEPQLLDLCCGAGHLSHFFLEKGYRVIGLDLSPAMLDYARGNCAEYVAAGRAQFILGDAADFRLNQPVDLVCSTFDALNHLPDRESLRQCFRCVHAACLPGGMFIFDLNTRLGLRRWATVSLDENPDLSLMTTGLFDETGGKAHTRITGFLRAQDGRYDRFEETAYNTAFDMATVQADLLDASFHQAHIALLNDLSTPLVDPEQEGRVFFVARR